MKKHMRAHKGDKPSSVWSVIEFSGGGTNSANTSRHIPLGEVSLFVVAPMSYFLSFIIIISIIISWHEARSSILLLILMEMGGHPKIWPEDGNLNGPENRFGPRGV